MTSGLALALAVAAVCAGYAYWRVQAQQATASLAKLLKAENPSKESLRRHLIRGADVNVISDHRTTALVVAARSGDLALLEELLARGAMVNGPGQRGSEALLAAAEAHHTQIQLKLLSVGASPLIRDRCGTAPWVYAISSGNVPLLERYLAAGIPVDAPVVPGHTALMTAREFGHQAVVRLLKQAGAKR
ncbi:MAG: ankyrin repeat domain-containing protein [Actinomycetota bacterium]